MLEREGDRIPELRDLFRERVSETGYRVMAELLPHGRRAEIADSYTLIPEDQPGELARLIRELMND